MADTKRWPERKMGRAGLAVGPHGFGAAPIGNLGRVVPEDEWPGAVPAAWDAGVRYFDAAPHCGLGLAEHRLAAGPLQAQAIDVMQIDACRVAGVNENITNLLLAAGNSMQMRPESIATFTYPAGPAWSGAARAERAGL